MLQMLCANIAQALSSTFPIAPKPEIWYHILPCLLMLWCCVHVVCNVYCG